MLVLEESDPELYSRMQERNLIRQYDLLISFIEIGIHQGPHKYMLWALNHTAVAAICQFGGRFREEPIYVGSHKPPHFRDVPELMDRFISTVHENWFQWSPTDLAAYALWKLLWIHPFIEGNGRTARAVCYYLLCAKSGVILPGRKIVPERIRENRAEYYAALQEADKAWDKGDLDFSLLSNYLNKLLMAQLADQ